MFLPLRDHLPTTRLPILTIALIAINCFVFIAAEGNSRSLERAVVSYGAAPYELTHSGKQCVPDRNFTTSRCGPTAQMKSEYGMSFPNAWLTVLTSMFLHGGIMHLLGNMLFLGVFGRAVEDAIGRFSFLLFYLVGGVAAVFGHTLYEPNSQIQCVGASGAIASVMAGYFVMFPRAKVTSLFIFFPCEPRAVWVIGTWLAEQMLIAWMMAGSGAVGGVAVFAHFGGFAFGLAMTYLMLSRAEIADLRARAVAAAGDLDLPPPAQQLAPPPLPQGYPQPAYAAVGYPQQAYATYAQPGYPQSQAYPNQAYPPAPYPPAPYGAPPPPPAGAQHSAQPQFVRGNKQRTFTPRPGG